MRDEREAARNVARESDVVRQGERDEREQKWRNDVDERRCGESKERSQRKQRTQQLHMAMLARILGRQNDKQEKQSVLSATYRYCIKLQNQFLFG